MKGYLGALTALALIGSVSFANAEEASGTVQTIDEQQRIITLEDGTTFILAEGVSTEGLEPGAEVTVSFEMEGEDKVVRAVRLLEFELDE